MTYTYTICHLNAYFSNFKAKSTLNRRFLMKMLDSKFLGQKFETYPHFILYVMV